MSYETEKKYNLKYADDQYDIGYKNGYRKAMSVLDDAFPNITCMKLSKPVIPDEVDPLNL